MAAGIKPVQLSVKQLSQAGQALFGDRWKRPLSRFLGKDQRTVHRWLDGTHAIPAEIAPVIYAELLLRENQAHSARAMLRKASGGKQ